MRNPEILIVATLALAGPAHADVDAAKGEAVFKKCMACHTADTAQNKVGPYLKGVVGRATASVKGYSYSKAMLAKGESGQVWDEATLDLYLADPKKLVPGTKMAFIGLRKPDERANVIAFLKSKP